MLIADNACMYIKYEADAVMREKTRKEYISIAEHFYRTHLAGQVPDADNIWGALLRCAPDYTPAYFNRLRCALAFHQNSIGNGWSAKIIRETQNPVKVIKGGFTVPASRRAKWISVEKLISLVSYLQAKGLEAECAALLLVYRTGARPCEFASMKVVGEKIFIEGAKKTEKGDRGADRALIGARDGFASEIDQLLIKLRSSRKTLDAMRSSIYEAVQILFPGDEKQVSMYTMRHQFGANLKASGISRVEMAYIMGHQSTESISKYGDKRRGVSGAVMVKPDPDADLSQIRDKNATKIWNVEPHGVFPELDTQGLQDVQKQHSAPRSQE